MVNTALHYKNTYVFIGENLDLIVDKPYEKVVLYKTISNEL
ncbi:MAG: hypothetical protein H6Q70_1386 [Firmicutes bacterium]|nr:hypothetical protein [Bacillota bacterium]